MSAKLSQQKIQFTNALERFQELLEPKNIVERDAVIQRFEFTFDLGWKTLKSILEEKYSLEIPTPIQAFQEAVRIGILSESPVWLEMRDMRHLTSHSYSESTAVKLAEQTKKFSSMFDELKILFSKTS